MQVVVLVGVRYLFMLFVKGYFSFTFLLIDSVHFVARHNIPDNILFCGLCFTSVQTDRVQWKMWLMTHLPVFRSSLINTFVVSFLNMHHVYVGFRGCLDQCNNTSIGIYPLTIHLIINATSPCARIVGDSFFPRLVIIVRILVVK